MKRFRRWPMLVVFVLVAAGLVVSARRDDDPVGAVFSDVAAPWMPAAPAPGGLSSTWFCPGVPAAPARPLDGSAGDEDDDDEEEGLDDRTAGSVTVVNPTDTAMSGTLTLLTIDDEPVAEPFSVSPFGTETFDIDERADSMYAAAIVEIVGGGGLVEQKATWPVGSNSVAESVQACANSPSDEWYFATGDTSDGSQDLLVLTNPYDHTAQVDIRLATSRGTREVTDFTVPAKSVRTVDLRDHTVDIETDVGVTIDAARGAVIAARAQLYDTPTRDGYSMVLGAPALRDQWWFVAGERADDTTVEYSVYNPGEDDVLVYANVLGFPAGDDFLPPEPFEVPDGGVVSFSLADVDNVPDGPVAAVFATNPEQPVVVERTWTREITGIRTTSVAPGGAARPDGHVPSTWYLGIGPDDPTEGVIRILNADLTPAVVTVQAITPDGIVTVDSLDEVDLPGSGLITLDLTDPQTVGNPLIVRSTSRVFVERIVPREPNSQGRVASWLIPAG